MTPPDDARLDQLLHAWAARRRLDDRDATEIRDAIVATSGPTREPAPAVPLPATWWTDLAAQVTAAVVLASVRPGPGGSGRQVAGPAAA
jgi:hypothetical protein